MNASLENTTIDPRLRSKLLRSSLNRCYCVRCGYFFQNEAAFTAHELKVGICAANETALRAAGLRLNKTFDGGYQEWGL